MLLILLIENKRVGSVAQVFECLPSSHKAEGSNPSITHTKKENMRAINFKTCLIEVRAKEKNRM
jgi:hypothetical protein